MRIDKIEIKPVRNSINLEMIFEIELYVQKEYEIPVGIYGSIISDENKKIANISEYELTPQPNEKTELSARERESKGEQKLTMKVNVPLNYKVLDYIGTRRTVNSKGDVVLKLHISIRTLYSKTRISSMFVAESTGLPNLPKEYKDSKFVLHGDCSNQSSRFSDMRILSGDNSAAFIEFKNNNFENDVTIKSSDWIYDFCPVFQIGKFLVFEYLIPNYAEGIGNTEERLANSINAIKKMEEHIVRGEWNEVIEHSRAVGELLKNRGEIRDLLTGDGYTCQALEDLNESLKKLFDFASKFHHREDKEKNIMPEIRASKEDAYLIYSVSMNVVNLISKKIQRLDKR